MRPIDADKLRPIELDLMLAVPYEDIKDAPTIDAFEVVHGHWIWGEVLLNRQTCSCCKAHFDCLEIDNYCPNCGAKMDEVSK